MLDYAKHDEACEPFALERRTGRRLVARSLVRIDRVHRDTDRTARSERSCDRVFRCSPGLNRIHHRDGRDFRTDDLKGLGVRRTPRRYERSAGASCADQHACKSGDSQFHGRSSTAVGSGRASILIAPRLEVILGARCRRDNLRKPEGFTCRAAKRSTASLFLMQIGRLPKPSSWNFSIFLRTAVSATTSLA
jgi:hypothetical protein